MKQKLILSCVALVCLMGCGEGGPPTTTPPANPVGTMSAQEQLDALKNNTTMPPEVKERKMRMLERKLGLSSDSPVGRKPATP